MYWQQLASLGQAVDLSTIFGPAARVLVSIQHWYGVVIATVTINKLCAPSGVLDGENILGTLLKQR